MLLSNDFHGYWLLLQYIWFRQTSSSPSWYNSWVIIYLHSLLCYLLLFTYLSQTLLFSLWLSWSFFFSVGIYEVWLRTRSDWEMAKYDRAATYPFWLQGTDTIVQAKSPLVFNKNSKLQSAVHWRYRLRSSHMHLLHLHATLAFTSAQANSFSENNDDPCKYLRPQYAKAFLWLTWPHTCRCVYQKHIPL